MKSLASVECVRTSVLVQTLAGIGLEVVRVGQDAVVGVPDADPVRPCLEVEHFVVGVTDHAVCRTGPVGLYDGKQPVVEPIRAAHLVKPHVIRFAERIRSDVGKR